MSPAIILRLVPLIVLASGVAACVKAVTAPRGDAALSNLAGSQWSPDETQDVFVQFRSKGEIAGFGGCNNFFGSYEQNGQRLIVGPLASTRKMCAEPARSEFETRFISALQNTHHIEATHLRLVLLDEHRNILLRLRRDDWD